jgi:hypothetical protein
MTYEPPKVTPISGHGLKGDAPPRGVLHRLKVGVYDASAPTVDAEGNDVDPTSAAYMFVCGEGELAYALAFEEFPPDTIRAQLPPHDVCRVCWPAGAA